MKHRHVCVAQRQSQLHLQQTRPYCVFSLFSFCHCLVSTCSIIVTLISSLSPSDLNYPFPFSGSGRFLLSIVDQMHVILAMLRITPCLFLVFNSNVHSYTYSFHWQGLHCISSVCESNVAIARLFPVWSPFLAICFSRAGCFFFPLRLVCTLGGYVHTHTQRSIFLIKAVINSVTNGSVQR